MAQSSQWSVGTISAIRDLTTDIREFLVKPEQAVLPFEPGSHLQVKPLVNGERQVRSYSLIYADSRGYRIAVKRLQHGRGGSRAMWDLAVGDALPISTPANHFSLDLNASEYLLVAAGIGVTPMMSMARALSLLKKRKPTVKISLLYAARTDEDFAYRAELQSLAGVPMHLRNAKGHDRLDLPAEFAQLGADAQVYLCGPNALMKDAQQHWSQAKRAVSNLRFETFGSSAESDGVVRTLNLRIPRHSLDLQISSQTSLLDAIERAGIQTVSDCRRGECGLCAMDILELDGTIEHKDFFLSESEKRANTKICVCVSRAQGTLVLDTAYRNDSR